MNINPEHVAAVAEWLMDEQQLSRQKRSPLADVVLTTHSFSSTVHDYLRLCVSPNSVRSICTAVGMPLSDATPDTSEIDTLMAEGWLEVEGGRYSSPQAGLLDFIWVLNGMRAYEATI